MLHDSGAGKTTMTYDDVLAQDYRKIGTTPAGWSCRWLALHLLLRAGQPQGAGQVHRRGATWAYPYNDLIVASGLIPGVNAIPTQNLMPPGVPGREQYDPVEGHGPFQTDPAKAKQILTDSGNLGYEIKFLFATDNDTSWPARTTLVKGLEAAGFKVTPVATTEAKSVADRDDLNGADQRACLRLVLRLAVGCDLDAADLPVDGPRTRSASAPTSRRSATPRSTRRSTTSSRCPTEEQPKAWNELDKEIMTTYLPVVPRYYGGVAQSHGSQIEGMNVDNTLGMPTFRDIWVNAG